MIILLMLGSLRNQILRKKKYDTLDLSNIKSCFQGCLCGVWQSVYVLSTNILWRRNFLSQYVVFYSGKLLLEESTVYFYSITSFPYHFSMLY